MSERLEDLRRHYDALRAFVNSPAHAGYQEAIHSEIQATKDAILAITPDSLPNFIEECQLRGELRLLEQELSRFEVASVNLETRIDEMAEAELENATQPR